MKKLKKFSKNSLLILFVITLIIGELFIDSSTIWSLCIVPILSLGAIILILKSKNKPLEKIVSFFIFPIFTSQIFQALLIFIIKDSNTKSIFFSLLFIPLSNFFYVIFLIKTRKVSFKEIGHMVTTIQSILFVSTLIGFIVKNPLLFDGILVKTKMSYFGLAYPYLSSLSISQVIETLTQTIFIPYLTSESMIKGWVEYNNFLNEQVKH